MLAHRSDDHEPTRDGEPHQAPEPKTAELTAEQRDRRLGRREGAVAILFLLGLVAIHIAVHIPRIGTWAALALVIVAVGLSLVRSSDGARDGGSLAKALRGLFLFWLAVSVASVVLVSLDSFSRENILLLAVVWGILLVLWLGDHGLGRVLANR